MSIRPHAERLRNVVRFSWDIKKNLLAERAKHSEYWFNLNQFYIEIEDKKINELTSMEVATLDLIAKDLLDD